MAQKKACKRRKAGPSSGCPKKRHRQQSVHTTATENEAGDQSQQQCDPLLTRFGPSTWKKDIEKYANPPIPFTGLEPGCTHPDERLPSLLGLFDKFWSPKLQRRIVRETNRYASKVVDDKVGRTRGGWNGIHLGWKNFVLTFPYAS
jgi:hypothetical protein